MLSSTDSTEALRQHLSASETEGMMLRLNKKLKADFIACVEYSNQSKEDVLVPVIEAFILEMIEACDCQY